MENIFSNGFGTLRSCTKITEIFSDSKSSRSNFYSLLWVTDGIIELAIDDIGVQLSKNEMAFVTPVKYVRILKNKGKLNIIQFNREFYCIRENDHEVSCEGILYFGAQGVPRLSMDRKQAKSFERLLGVLQEEFEIVDTIQEEMLRVVLKKWLIKATRIMKQKEEVVNENHSKTELLRQFNVLLEKNFKASHKVGDYARLLNKSPKTITNHFKILGQESPSKMIQERVTIEAKRYLLYSHLSIKEIAVALGFNDAPYFSNYFKRKTRISPARFRELNQMGKV